MIRTEPCPSEPVRAPGWARPRRDSHEISEAESLYFAGAALAALDSIVRSDPPPVGRGVAPPSGAQIRRRRGAKPAQPRED